MPQPLRALLVVVALTLAGGVVQAQTINKALRGIEGVDLVVEDPDADGRACGLSTDLLDSAVRINLATTRMKVTKEAIPFIAVEVLTAPPSGGACVGSISIQLQRPVEIPGVGRQMATVWFKGSLLQSPRSAFPTEVTRKLESLTKLFLGEWLRSQP